MSRRRWGPVVSAGTPLVRTAAPRSAPIALPRPIPPGRVQTASPRHALPRSVRPCLARATLPATPYTPPCPPRPITSPSAIERDAMAFADPARGERNSVLSDTTTRTNGASSDTTTQRTTAFVTAHYRNGRYPVRSRHGRRGRGTTLYLPKYLCRYCT